MHTHVVFIHGLSGHIEKTWTIEESGARVLWPKWLSEDISGIGLWLVGYPAAKTNWGGYGMPLSDRADNILARLIAEPRLEKGNVIFVVHSLGGLVVEQLMRNAQRDSTSNRKVEELLSRIRRIAFLGTPHRGALLANIGKAFWFLIRPSAATRDLVLGNPQLRDLNFWYRKYSFDNGIDNLVLAEGRPERIFGVSLPGVIGRIVSPSSADPGLPVLPVTVDESHISICKPANRDADVYFHLKDFISRPFGVAAQVTRTVEAIENNTATLERLAANTIAQNEAITELTRTIERGVPAMAVDTAIIDAEVSRQLERLRKGRQFGAFDTTGEARMLAESLMSGGLALASNSGKAKALAWCARFLSVKAPDEAQSALDAIASEDTELAMIARGMIMAGRGQLKEALGELTHIDTPIGRGAAYICVVNAKGFEEACQWLHDAGVSHSDLDSDAKFFYVKGALENGSWTLALEAASGLIDADFERTPALYLAAADAYLMQAVPDELRTFLMQYIPFDAVDFSLRSDPENLTHRRTAIRFYEQMCSAARELSLNALADHADDRALWLRLMDPEMTTDAKHELAESIRNPAILLRRLILALQSGLDIDLVQVEKEIDRQTALSGGTSCDAATARFALASAQKSRAAAAAYIEKHREQLLEHLNWKGVYFFEIEMLAKSGQPAQAQVRLQEAIDRGLTNHETTRLRRLLAEAAGADPIAERLAIYEESRSIADLRLLVFAYEEANNWEKIVEYGERLLDLTGDIADARRYAIALYNLDRLDDVLAVFGAFPSLSVRYDKVNLLHAQTLFELGRLDEARSVLKALRQISDSPDARQLQINLAALSGDWESLQGFVENEWNARAERTAVELFRAGRIAQDIGLARGKDLVLEAAKKGADDPAILVNCYLAASAAGWENSPQVHQWFERAASLSEQSDNGLIQRMSIEDVIERKPSWDKHETDVWSMLAKGEIPLFTAGRLVNRSLIGLFLLPALSNLSQTDVRKRPPVYGFSGARGACAADPQTIAMDPTALMTAEFLGVLDLYINTFDRVVIPHNTLGWLLEEKARVLFHQPSRVAAAHELRRMIAEQSLQVFDGRAIPPETLVREVGDELARLFAEASSKDHPDTRQRLVVRGGPIHKAGTFMKEEADLLAYQSHLCSSYDVVDKLSQKGVLTAPEVDEARAALKLREKPWPSNIEIADGAVLYLDDLAASHLEYLGLLSKLQRADVTAIVSRSEIEEADSLIAYDAKSAELVTIVERMRIHLRDGLESGKVRLGRAFRFDDKEESHGMQQHPTLALPKLIQEADACVVDDRFVNQHASITSGSESRPLMSTLDILEALHRRGALSPEKKQQARTSLRRANYALMPIDHAELSGLLSASSVKNEILIETAELKAIRESVLRLRMTDVLQPPKELVWLNSMVATCLMTLKEQWMDGLDEPTTIARSDWLVALSDVRGWTHRLNEDSKQLMARYRNWVALLIMLPAAQSDSVKSAYWRWLDSRILGPIAEEDPETYAFLIEYATTRISQGIESLLYNSEDTQ